MPTSKTRTLQEAEEYTRFKKTVYVDFMVANEDKPIEVNFNELKKFSGAINLDILIFNKPFNFAQLDVQDEKQFILKYFNYNYEEGYGSLKREYHEKYSFNGSFIALLIDLGYDAVEGDPVPNLNIFAKPFLQFLPSSQK